MTFEEYLDDLNIDWEHDAADLHGMEAEHQDYLDDNNDGIFGFLPSEILKTIDPIQYAEGLANYCDDCAIGYYDAESRQWFHVREVDAGEIDLSDFPNVREG